MMKMAISVGPDQTAPLRMSFDQRLHCLFRPIRLNTCLGLGWLHATFLFFLLLCKSRTSIRMLCSSCALAVDIHCCCICCCCYFYVVVVVVVLFV